MSYFWSLFWFLCLSALTTVCFFTDLLRGKKKKGRTSGPALHQVLQQDKVFPINSESGWELNGIYQGVRVWKHKFVISSLEHLMYGCNLVVTATPQEVLSTLKDVNKHREWDMYTEYSLVVSEPCSSNGRMDNMDNSNCHDNQQQQQQQQQPQQQQQQLLPHQILTFDTISTVPKYNTRTHQLKKLLVRLSNYIPGITVVEHENLAINITRCWQTDIDESTWMFLEPPETNIHDVLWTYIQARPLQDNPGCLLTIAVCPEKADTRIQKMIASQLASMKDYFQLQKVKLQLPQEETVGFKIKAFAGQLKKRAQTFSFKKESQQLDSADAQAIQNELRTVVEVDKAAEKPKKSPKDKKTEWKLGKRLSFDFYKNMAAEKTATKVNEILNEPETDYTRSPSSSFDSTSSTATTPSASEETRAFLPRRQSDEQIAREPITPLRRSNSDIEDTKRTLAQKLKDLAESRSNARKSSVDKSDGDGQISSSIPADDTRDIVERKLSASSSDGSKPSTGQNTPTKSSKVTPPPPSNIEMKQFRIIANQAAAEVLAEALRAASIDVSASEADQRKQTGGWQFQGLEKEVVILRKQTDSTGYHSFLGKGLIKAPPKAVYEAVKNPLTRFTYDNMVKKLDVLANLGTGVQIIHMVHEIAQIFRKDSRDLCVLQTSRIDGDLYIVGLSSVDWPDCQSPDNAIRATILPSGWVIEPAFRNRKVQSMVTYMVQIDVGGKDIPASFFNFLSKRLPLSIAYLRQYLQSGLP